MVVDLADLAHGPRILQLGGRLALDPQADDVLAPHTDLRADSGCVKRCPSLVLKTNLRTTVDTALTAVVPLRTASSAYSTWNRWPSGENTVIARS